MGLFRRRGTEKPAEPAPERVFKPADENNWHEWVSIAAKYLEEDNFARAVMSWCEAVEHFDGSDMAFSKLHDDAVKAIYGHVTRHARTVEPVPAQIIAEIDVSVADTHPDLAGYRFSSDVFEMIRNHISDMDDRRMMCAQFMSAAYCVMGYLRFSTDLNVSADKCDEAYKFGGWVWEAATKLEKIPANDFKTKLIVQYVANAGKFFNALSQELRKTANSMTSQNLSALTDYRREHMDDRIDHLSRAMQYALHSEGARHMNKKKAAEGLQTEIAAYISEFTKMD